MGLRDFRDCPSGFFVFFPLGIFHDILGIFSRLKYSDPDPDLRDFAIFGSLHSGFFQDSQNWKSEFGIPKKSHPEANSVW